MEGLRDELPLLRLLRRVFLREPEMDLLEGIGAVVIPSDEQGESSGLKTLIESVRRNRGRLLEWKDELSCEFARLFIGPTDAPAVPFASFYLSETHSLMTEETMAVRKQYLEAGLALKNLHQMPDDHIAIELDFLHYLTEKSVELSEKGENSGADRYLRMRHHFLTDHFSRWASIFADRILQSTSEDYFKGAAWLLLEMVKYHKDN